MEKKIIEKQYHWNDGAGVKGNFSSDDSQEKDAFQDVDVKFQVQNVPEIWR